ncbi:MAG TPA: zinc ribbon domain-containing protein [Dongiaceae bacterium]|nr:zinc ribbon domain-containing protein [Dongiaceae bacterium]
MPGFNPGLGMGYGFTTLIWIIAIVIVGSIVWRGRKGFVQGTTMVMKSFRINEDPSAKRCVEITGRAAGVVSWLMNVLKLEPSIEFWVTDSEVVVRSGSLSGLLHICVPIQKISATVCGYQRSILALGFAILFSLGFVLNILSALFGGNRYEFSSDMAQAFGFLVLGGIAALFYFLSKRIGIGVESRHMHGIVFKRSVIENVSVDLPEALRVAEVINKRLLAAQIKQPAPSQECRAQSSGPSHPTVCPRCSSSNPAGTRFCESCGSAL